MGLLIIENTLFVAFFVLIGIILKKLLWKIKVEMGLLDVIAYYFGFLVVLGWYLVSTRTLSFRSFFLNFFVVNVFVVFLYLARGFFKKQLFQEISGSKKQIIEFFAVFSLSQMLLFVTAFWPLKIAPWSVAKTGFLPLPSIGNNDIYNYLNISQFLSDFPKGIENIRGLSFYDILVGDVFGSFFLISLKSLFSFTEPLFQMAGVLILICSLISSFWFFYLRIFFNISFSIALVLVLLFISNPFFQYIFFNYFLGQMLAGLLFLSLSFSIIIQSRHRVLSTRKFIIIAIPFFLILIYSYFSAVLPTLLFYSVLTIFCSVNYNLKIRDFVKSFFKQIPLKICVMPFLILLGVFLVANEKFMMGVKAIYAYRNMAVGWPLKFISPLSVVGVRASSGAYGYISGRRISDCLALLTIFLVLFFGLRKMFKENLDKNAFEFRSQLLVISLFCFSYIVYLMFFVIYGESYQQWKFAFSYPVLFSFSLWGLLGSQFAFKKTYKVLFILCCFYMIFNNVWTEIQVPRQKTPSSWFFDLRKMDLFLASYDYLIVDELSYDQTMILPSIIRRPPLQLTSISYYPFRALTNELTSKRSALLTNKKSNYITEFLDIEKMSDEWTLIKPGRGFFRIAAVAGGHRREENKNNWWIWTEHRLSFKLESLFLDLKLARTKIHFEVNTHESQEIRVVLVLKSGQEIETKIQINEKKSFIMDEIKSLYSGDISGIFFETKGPPKTSFAIKNLSLTPI